MSDSPLISSPYSAECRLALAAVREAASLCQRVQARDNRGVMTKADSSPVTIADFGSQALLCRAIAETFPADAIMAEERSAALFERGAETLAERTVAEITNSRPGIDLAQVGQWIDRGCLDEYAPRYWALDPIDGTVGFVAGRHYAVCMALVVEGEVVVGAIGCPRLAPGPLAEGAGVVLLAAKGCGTWEFSQDDPSAPPRQLHVSQQCEPRASRFCESFDPGHSWHENAVAATQRLGVTKPAVRIDSQVKYGLVARGDVELYVRIPLRADRRERVWDHAAGSLLVTEAGGTVTDLRGRPLSFAHGTRLQENFGILATNGKFHSDAVKAVSQE